MTYTNMAAVNNAPMNAKDLENHNAITSKQSLQKNRGWNLKKGAIALVCAATAGATLRELATQHVNSGHHGHSSRMLRPNEGNSTFNNSTLSNSTPSNSTLSNSTLGNSTADNTTCPDGYYRFDKESTLKRAKITAAFSMGVLPGIGIAAGIASQVFDIAACPDGLVKVSLYVVAGLSVNGIIMTLPFAISNLRKANSVEDGTCRKSNTNKHSPDGGSLRGTPPPPRL